MTKIFGAFKTLTGEKDQVRITSPRQLELQYHHKKNITELMHTHLALLALFNLKGEKQENFISTTFKGLEDSSHTSCFSECFNDQNCTFPGLMKIRNISSAKLHLWLSGICGLALRPVLEVAFKLSASLNSKAD